MYTLTHVTVMTLVVLTVLELVYRLTMRMIWNH